MGCSSRASRRCTGLGGNEVFTLDQATLVLAGPHMAEGDVPGDGSEERYPGAEEHRNAGDNEALDEPGLEKPLNGDPAIDIDVPHAARGQARHDLCWIPRFASCVTISAGAPDIRSTTAPGGAGASGPVLSTNTGFSPYGQVSKARTVS